jgi:hypothetical protein
MRPFYDAKAALSFSSISLSFEANVGGQPSLKNENPARGTKGGVSGTLLGVLLETNKRGLRLKNRRAPEVPHETQLKPFLP